MHLSSHVWTIAMHSLYALVNPLWPLQLVQNAAARILTKTNTVSARTLLVVNCSIVVRTTNLVPAKI